MSVLYYQLFIVFTLAGLRIWQGKPAALIGAIAWSAWTLAMVYSPVLMGLQLAVVWATFATTEILASQRSRIASGDKTIKEQSRTIRDQEIKLSELEASISEESVETRDAVRDAYLLGQVAEVSGRRHMEELRRALRSARDTICIVSAWVRSGVVNDEFQSDLRDALMRGVDVYIGHGWQNYDGSISEKAETREARLSLERIVRESREQHYPGKLYLHSRLGTHRKLLVKDDDYFILGSNNFLSNQSFVNDELSWKVSSSARAQIERDQIIELVTGHDGAGADDVPF